MDTSELNIQSLDFELQKGGGYNIFAAHGMICAIVSGPYNIPEGLWMQFMWGMWRNFDSVSERCVLEIAILKFKTQITHILKKRCGYYPFVRYDQKFNEPVFLEDLPNLILWARGYLQGIMLAKQFWNVCIDEIECIISQVKRIAMIDEAMIRQRIINKDTKRLEEMLKLLKKILPMIIPAIYDYWHIPKIIKMYNSKLNKLISKEKRNGSYSNNDNNDGVKIMLNDRIIATWKEFSNDIGYGNIFGVPFSNQSNTKH